jgi:hypothetical protein
LYGIYLSFFGCSATLLSSSTYALIPAISSSAADSKGSSLMVSGGDSAVLARASSYAYSGVLGVLSKSAYLFNLSSLSLSAILIFSCLTFSSC